LRRNYDFCKRGLLEWTLGVKCPDGDLLPHGYGIIEVEGLNLQCIDTATHTVEALAAMVGMAEVLGEGGVAARCRDLYSAARARLEEAFWMEAEGLYGDMLATPAEMLPRLRRWAQRASHHTAQGAEQPGGRGTAQADGLQQLAQEAASDPHQDRKRPWLCKNWAIICPLEAGLPAPEKAIRTLERLEAPEFTGRWGMYLSGIDRTRIMSINTGVMAAAELAYKRVEQALRYIRMIAETLPLHMPGAISEMSPDGGCFVQAWSGYGIAWPVVTQVFGLQPDAFRRRLVLSPTFPVGWTEARLSGVRVGSITFDVAWDGRMLTVTSHEPGWTVTATGVPIQVKHG
jgi:glycogen debranching enzyme